MREIDRLRSHLMDIARAHAATAHADKGAVMFAYATGLGISVQTLYRKLDREIGYVPSPSRKLRADKGTTCVPADSLDFVAAAQKVSRRKNGKLVLATTTARALAVQHGVPVDVSANRLQKLLKERGIDAQTQARDTPPIQLRSLHPNHVHLFDWSVCLMYYAPNGQQVIVREDMTYKNKPDQLIKFAKRPDRLLRGVLADHATGMLAVHYVATPGERKEDLFSALMHCWQKIEGRVFHGVPKILYTDKGLDRSHAINNLMDALAVEHISHKAGNARATGGVENPQNIVERNLESLLRFQPARSVEELNVRAFHWCNAFNANLIQGYDSRIQREGLRAVRLDLWLTHIREEHIRLCPPTDECAIYMRGASATRTVSNGLTVSYRHPNSDAPRTYHLGKIRELRAGETVIVRPMVYSDEGIVIEYDRYDGGKHTTGVIGPVRDYDAYGRRMDSPVIGEAFASLPAHQAEQDGKRLDRIAYGVDADGVCRDADAIEKAKNDIKATPFANFCEGKGLKPFDVLKGIKLPTYLPKKGTVLVPKIEPLQPLRSTAVDDAGLGINTPGRMALERVRLDAYGMVKILKPLLADWSGEKYALLVERWPDGVFEDEVEDVVAWFSGRARLALVKSS